MKILFISLTIVLLSIYTIYWFVVFLKKRLRDKTTSSLPFFGLLALISALTVYDIILIIGLMSTNRELIEEYGKETISKTVAFTTTAIAEGFGKTSDHFENKWEINYLNSFEQIEIRLIDYKTFRHNDQRLNISLDIEFKNSNKSNTELNLNTISNKNYILISEDRETFYPLEFDHEQTLGNLPIGKTRLLMTGLIPIDFKPKQIKIGNQLHEL